MALKVCFIDVTHWHAPLYYPTLQQTVGVAALSARNPHTGREVAASLGARFYADWRGMIQQERPDFVFALGRHCDMAATARFLLQEGIPFAMEKPMGLNLQQVEELAELAAQKRAFVAVPFSIRMSPWVRKIKELEGPAADFSYATFRFHAGPVRRYYDNDNVWNLKRDEAGGGCLINVGIHFPDLYLYLTGKQPHSVYACTRNQVWGEEVEDFALVTVEMQDGALCIIECAYVHAMTPRVPSIEFSLHSKRYQFRSLGQDTMLWVDRQGQHYDLQGPQGNSALYPAFVVDTIDALQHGRAPVAGIEDNLAALRIVDAAYRSAAQGTVVQLSA
jgi:predicted dehydrogenase